MSPSTQWLSLSGGVVVILLGFKELYNQGEWILLILGLLIVAFTISSMIRSRFKEK
jgi:hypothetical protein